MSEPFCDFLSVSTPSGEWEAMRGDVLPVLQEVGASTEFENADGALWRVGEGTVKASRRGVVWCLSATGAVLAALRLARLGGEYLSAIGAHAHRVTRVDASLDRTEDTPPVIRRLLEAVASEGLAISRKRVPPAHVTRYVTRRPDGEDSGTAYFGKPSAEVRAVVYDKRLERMAHGLADVGPLTRYELRVRSGMNPTLRDAYAPAPMFWHFMSPAFLAAPEGVGEWVGQGEPLSLVRAPRALPAARLARRVEDSAEVAALLALADEVGPRGFDFLVGQLAKLHGRRQVVAHVA